MTWEELKGEGSSHYKNGEGSVEPIDLLRAAIPCKGYNAFDIKALGDVIKYAYRLLVRGYLKSDAEKIIHYMRLFVEDMEGGGEMREITFRQWISDKKRMDYGIGIVKDGHWRGPSSVTFEVDPLMQSTGLKDSQGREIYENDLLEGENGNVVKVIFDGACFCMEDKCDSWILDGHEKYWTIIGNLHENPELLKG